MADHPHDSALPALRASLRPLSGLRDIEAITARIGAADFVLLGEASHGTHDFYDLRAAVTRRLIETHRCRAVTIEGDWPDARRVDRFVRGQGDDDTADAALQGFRRFPQWMWRNTVVRDFVTWLRGWNARQAPEHRCGFYGLDLYSLHGSIHAVLRYLEQVDPPAAHRARGRYSCFEAAGSDDPQLYGLAVSRDHIEACEDDVVRQLRELIECEDEYRRREGPTTDDDFFSAEQNARLVANAERYYRSMFRGRVSSWNLRDTHMFETLEAVAARLEHEAIGGAVCVWAHNSHLGDARATQMGQRGELNLGQLVREHYGNTACLVGLTTYTGSVTASHEWDDPARRRYVRPGLAGSTESLMHRVGVPRFLLDLREPSVRAALTDRRLERAIGVIYRPETERMSHYFQVELGEQFDLLIHLDETTALEPLERHLSWDNAEVPETYPSGF
jgi:erythromycin esterase-like protein